MTNKEAIEWLAKDTSGAKIDSAELNGENPVTYINEAIEVAIEALEAQEKYRWVPVSERLPEDRSVVLVTAYWHEAYQVMTASYFGYGLWWCVPFDNIGNHLQRLNPIAWMPLPAPYKEGGKEYD